MTTPKIRFEGFDDEWEFRRLHEVMTLGSGKDHKPLGTGDIPVYGTGGYMLSVDQALSSDKDAIGIGRKGTIDKPFILRAPFWTVDTLFFALPKEHQDLDYLLCLFRNIDWSAHDESTGVPSLSRQAINSVEARVAPSQEQKAIGNYFRNLDELIERETQKLTYLRSLKSTMLVKMFPQAGSAVPEIRFEGFDDEWNDVQISSVATDDQGGGTPSTARREFWDGTIPWIQSSDVEAGKTTAVEPTKYITAEAIRSSAASVIPANSLAIVTRVGVGKLATMTSPYATSQDFISLTGLTGDIDFLAIAIQQAILRDIGKLQGSTIKGMTRSDILDKHTQVPSPAEQKTIGTYFRNLDELIELEEGKLTKLNNLKSSLLTTMFV